MRQRFLNFLDLLLVFIPVLSTITVVALSAFNFAHLSWGVILLMANLPLLMIIDNIKTCLED